MAVSSGFFNSVSHDRQYNASHFGEFFDGIINDGVFTTVGDQFTVTPGKGMKVNVAAGKGWFKGTYILNDAPIVLSINAADPILRRIDAVVLDINTDAQVRRNTITVVTGTAGTNPDKPTLIDTQRHKQYPLAYVTIPAGSTKISSQNIEDCIASGETPKAKSLLESDAMAKNHYCSEDPNNEVVDVAHGGTGASSAAGARTNLGLGSVATESTLPVSKGGTGKTSITSGTVLVGNGTNTPTERTIDTTSGGTANSNALITSGAVNAGISAEATARADAVSAEATARADAVSAEATARANAITALKQSFTDGCNAIAQELRAKGVTPTKSGENYTPTDFINAIDTLIASQKRAVAYSISEQSTIISTWTENMRTYHVSRNVVSVNIGGVLTQHSYDNTWMEGGMGANDEYFSEKTWTQNV